MKEKESDNISFYTDLYTGKVSRNMFGIDYRFSPDKIAAHPSVQKHLIPILEKHISLSDKVLDLGCGPGSFFAVVAPRCSELIGVDIVPVFIEAANEYINKTGLKNSSAHNFADFEKTVA